MIIEDYYGQKYTHFQDEISVLNVDQILKINSKESSQEYYEQIKLPLILRDETRPLKKEVVSKILVYDSDGETRLNKTTELLVSYPIKPFGKINEVLSRQLERIENINADWNIRNKSDCIEIRLPPSFVRGSYGYESEDDKEQSEQRMNEVIQYIETNIAKKNSKVKQYNNTFSIWLIDYLEKLKKAILKDQEVKEYNKTKARNQGNDDSDWDYDDESSRSPNDDRSDSLNPNNSAYQAAQDNHANQLNSNNSRYQGE